MGDGERRVAARTDLIHREVGEQIFLLLPDGTMHWLKNASAVALWRAVSAAGEAGAAVGALASALTAAFEVDEARAREDATRFVDHLLERGLVRVSRTPHGAPSLD